MKIVLITLALLIVGFAVTTTAHAETPYEVGFQDGCTDAPIVGIAAPSQLAANHHSNAGHHSAQYLDGYSAGIINCGNSSGSYSAAAPDSNSHQNGYGGQNEYNNNNRYQAQSQTATPHFSCFTLIGSCRGGETYQGQSLNN